MLLKKSALQLYKVLPTFLQRKAVRVLYPGYVVAAKVFITDNTGKFLAVQTSYHPNWDIPSGHCDPKESPDLAARRELLEETNLQVENLQQCGVIFYPNLRSVQVLFRQQLDSSPALTTSDPEIADLRWVNRGEVTLNPYAKEAVEVIVDHKAPYWVSTMS